MLLTSRPQRPLPWGRLLATMGGLWIAPVGAGGVVFLMSMPLTLLADHQPYSGLAVGLGLVGLGLILSPAFAWIGWLLAVPLVVLAVLRGWFGWGSALLIGAAAGAVAGDLAGTDLALPFGILALLVLRAILGRLLPL
jgi:hypothetical protein